MHIPGGFKCNGRIRIRNIFLKKISFVTYFSFLFNLYKRNENIHYKPYIIYNYVKGYLSEQSL